MYRATPHSTTEVSPFEAMYNRKMKLDLPIAATQSKVINQDVIERSQNRMKERAGKPHQLVVGDCVLVKQAKKNKLTPSYNPVPAIVTNIKGSMVTVHTGGTTITRDGSRFKKISLQQLDVGESPYDESSDEDAGDGSQHNEQPVSEDEEGSAPADDESNLPQQPDATAGAQPQAAEPPQVPVPQASSGAHRGSIAASRVPRSNAGKPPARFRDFEM